MALWKTRIARFCWNPTRSRAGCFGGGWPGGAVFKSRELKGYTWNGLPEAPITHRIFWLEGLEPGLNRGEGVDTFARYIYIHGTGKEPTIGKPASHGCIHVAAKDLLPLYDVLPEKTLVWFERSGHEMFAP